MKKIFCIAIAAVMVTALMFAQQSSSAESEDPIVQQYLDSQEAQDSSEKESAYVKKEKTVPEAKRPLPPSQEKIQEVIDKNPERAEQSYIDECNDTFKYGIEDQIIESITTLTSEEDPRFAESLYDLFQESKSSNVKIKILGYFEKLKDPCLEDFAVSIINDPYDEKKSVVDACFPYLSAAKSSSAVPGLVDLMEKEEGEYFNSALSCLGEVGSNEEAVYVSEYMDRDDLTVAQKQSLMKVLGKLKAVETYDKLVDIVQNEDEDSYVRMYAAEAIGGMQMEGAEEILIDLFEDDDPNFRVYVLKGLSNYTDQNATAIFIQALRDSHYKVRLEAINAVESQKLAEAVPYLIYRCKDKSEEQVVKDKCYKVLADFNTAEGNEYLVGLITDKKTGDTAKGKVAVALLKNNYAGSAEIIELAQNTLKTEIHRSLRYQLGKEFAKYGRPEYESICGEFLAHKDVSTQGTGLDIYAKGKYAGLTAQVEKIAQGTKKNANAKKARKILGIEEEKQDNDKE
ncbi:MAG: HEAT repeat domain-containing protein [Treponema sp.]|nr:HEAT repeat domain-containing protein [Treponema sp.]